MDHWHVEEHDIASKHLMGKLSPRERADFEEHFLDCPECLDLLETEEDLQRALKQAAAEDAGRTRNPAPGGLTGWLTGLGPWRQAALWTSAGLVLALAPAALYVRKSESARRGVGQGAVALREWQRLYETERQAGADLKNRLQESERKLQQQSSASGERSRFSEFPTVASVFILDTARSADPESSETPNRIEIGESQRWIVLAVERGSEPEFISYRVTITNAQGRVFWTKSGIPPARTGALSVAFEPSFFHDGVYVLRLEGMARGARYAPAVRYPFRVTITR